MTAIGPCADFPRDPLQEPPVSVAQAEANQCGTPVASSAASASPATTTSVSVNAGFFTIRLENTGPGDTGNGQWEVGLTRC